MKKILALAAALIVAAALTLFAAAPAQAVGWSGQRCDNTVEGVHVCVQVHTVNATTGFYKVDAVQLCMSMNRANNHVRGIKSNWISFPGTWGYGIPYVAKPGCSYSYPNYKMDNGCYVASGTVDLSVYPDNDHYRISGRILGGAC